MPTIKITDTHPYRFQPQTQMMEVLWTTSLSASKNQNQQIFLLRTRRTKLMRYKGQRSSTGPETLLEEEFWEVINADDPLHYPARNPADGKKPCKYITLRYGRLTDHLVRGLGDGKKTYPSSSLTFQSQRKSQTYNPRKTWVIGGTVNLTVLFPWHQKHRKKEKSKPRHKKQHYRRHRDSKASIHQYRQ